jgi:hypothetical protein
LDNTALSTVSVLLTNEIGELLPFFVGRVNKKSNNCRVTPIVTMGWKVNDFEQESVAEVSLSEVECGV